MLEYIKLFRRRLNVMNNEPSVLASWVLAIYRTIESYGVDPAPLLVEAGIDPNLLRQHEARIPSRKSNTLWRLGTKHCQDDLLGLRAPEYITSNSLYALDAAVQYASTLKEMIEILCKFSKVATTAVSLQLQVEDKLGKLEFRGISHVPLCDQAVDAFMYTITKTINAVLQRIIGKTDTFFVRFDVTRSVPSDLNRYVRFFGCPVNFGSKKNCIYFNSDLLDIPAPDANPSLSLMTEEVLSSYLSRIEHQDIEMRSRAIIHDLMRTQQLSKTNLASRMNMSERNLTRKLGDAEITFSHLVNSIRQEKAISLLKQSHIPIGEIAFNLGFEDVSSFIRYFRKWTGMTPGGFRSRREESKTKSN
mgnify:CR=1 FL=1